MLEREKMRRMWERKRKREREKEKDKSSNKTTAKHTRFGKEV